MERTTIYRLLFQSSPEIFSRIQLGIKSNHSSKNKKTQLSGSIILVPILVGSDRYGSMLIFDSNKNREYSAREIQLSLSVAIIIGLALKNQINRDLFLYTSMHCRNLISGHLY